MAFREAEKDTTTVYPESYKVSVDPEPFTFRYVTLPDGSFLLQGWEGTDKFAPNDARKQIEQDELHRVIIKTLRERGAMTRIQLAKTIGKRKEAVLTEVNQLLAEGLLSPGERNRIAVIADEAA